MSDKDERMRTLEQSIEAAQYLPAGPAREVSLNVYRAENLASPAVISKRRGDEVEIHYLIGPQRETREEAEADLARFTASAYVDSATTGTPEEADAELTRLVGLEGE